MSQILENGVSFPEYALPNITELFRIESVQNVNEAVTVVFHAYLLECGFLPKDVPEEDKYHYMPKDWNANGVFKINYTHKCCNAFACSVSFVFLYNNVSVHGIVCETACSDSVHMKMNFKKYIKQETFSSVNEIFCNPEELCILFKDNFSLPFLNLLHETVGERPLSGMPGLYDEIKLYILRLLSVEHVLKMAAVNKNFNHLASSSSLWKHLCHRDFSKDGVLDIDSPSSSSSSTETNWKEVYKKEFLKRKRKRESFFRLPRHPLPPFFDISPDIYTDIGINFDPPFPTFDPPYLQPKIPPFFRRLL